MICHKIMKMLFVGQSKPNTSKNSQMISNIKIFEFRIEARGIQLFSFIQASNASSSYTTLVVVFSTTYFYKM